MALQKEIQEKIDERKNANDVIIDILKKYLDEHPYLRFGQALVNLGIIRYDDTQLHHPIDPFYDESVDILENMNKYV